MFTLSGTKTKQCKQEEYYSWTNCKFNVSRRRTSSDCSSVFSPYLVSRVRYCAVYGLSVEHLGTSNIGRGDIFIVTYSLESLHCINDKEIAGKYYKKRKCLSKNSVLQKLYLCYINNICTSLTPLPFGYR